MLTIGITITVPRPPNGPPFFPESGLSVTATVAPIDTQAAAEATSGAIIRYPTTFTANAVVPADTSNTIIRIPTIDLTSNTVVPTTALTSNVRVHTEPFMSRIRVPNSTSMAVARVATTSRDVTNNITFSPLSPYAIPITPLFMCPSQPHPRPQGYLIDFSKTPLSPVYPGHFAAVIDNLFTPTECADFLSQAENEGSRWEQAMLNAGGTREVLVTAVRNSLRMIVDNSDMAWTIFKKVWPWIGGEVGVVGRDVVSVREGDTVEGKKDWWRKGRRNSGMVGKRPKEAESGTGTANKDGEGLKWRYFMRRITVKDPMRVEKERWEMTRLNERLRFLKYGPGDYFRPHNDGVFSTLILPKPVGRAANPRPEERSFLTVLLYLSSSPDLVGGATSFHGTLFDSSDQPTLQIAPVPGRVLVFQHRGLTHAADLVTRGQKIAVRTDIMFKRVGSD